MTAASSGVTTVPSGPQEVVRASPQRRTRRRVMLSLALLAALVAITLAAVSSASTTLAWTALGLATAFVAVPAAPVHRAAVTQLRSRRLGLDVLASLAVVVVYVWAFSTTATEPQTTWELGSSASVEGWGSALIATALVCLAAVARTTAQERAATGGDGGPASAWIAPAVLVIAALAFAGWAALGDAGSGLSAGVATLAVACPGAIGLAWPVAVARADRRGRAAGLGPFSIDAIVAASTVETVVLDGTATLTDGKRVASVDPLRPEDDRNLKWFAGALEHASDHAIGRAIARLAGRGHLGGVQHHPGTGISGSVDRHPVRVGRPDWIGLDPPDHLGTIVAIDVDGRPLGTITVVDQVRASAHAAVAQLRASGINVVLVTDRPEAYASSLAAEAGIHDVVASAKSADETIRRLLTEGRPVACVRAGDADDGARGVLTFAYPDARAATVPSVTLAEPDVAHAATALALARRAASSARRAGAWSLGLVGAGVVAVAALAIAPVIAATVALLVAGGIALAAAS